MPRRIFPAPLIPGAGRPPPPKDLSEREREIWIQAVESRPLHYFDAPTLPLLAAFCMHATIVEELARELRANPTDKLLRKEHRQESAVLAMLATKLRLSKLGRRPHQRTDAEQIARVPKRRLWEVT